MHLFTWNIGKRERLTHIAFLYLSRLADKDSVIATLQEWPGETSEEDLKELGLAAVPGAAKTVMFYSRDMKLQKSQADASGRAKIAQFEMASGKQIACIGLHWHSRHSHSEVVEPYERGGAMALFRHHLEERLDPGVPAVIMGDFNTTSHDGDMTSPYCLFALSPQNRVRPSMQMVMGRQKRPWCLLKSKMPQTIGSYYHKKNETWSVYDHIVLSPELAQTVLDGTILAESEVLTEMEENEFLVRKNNVPRTPKYASDHLPILCRIHYQ